MDRRQIFLRDVLTVLFKRKSLIVLFAVVVIAGVFVGNIVWPPTYESVAKIQLLRGRETLQSTAPLTDSSSTPLISMAKEDVNSEIEMIYSNDVLSEVAASIQGGVSRGVVGSIIETVTNILTMGGGSDPTQRQIQVLRSAIAVKPVKDSYTMEVYCRWPTAEGANQVLTALIESYKRKHNNVFSTPPEADKVLTDKMNQIRAEWSDAQAKLKEFRDSNNVYGLESERDLLVEELTKARRLAIQLEQLGSVASGLDDSGSSDASIMTTLGRETESTVITELRLRLLELLLRRNEIVQSKGPNHPDTLGISNQIKQAVARLQDAIEIAVSSTQNQITELETRLKDLNGVIDEHDGLVQEVEIRQESYKFFAQRVQEARVNTTLSDAGINNIVVVSNPNTPADPIRPRKIFNLVLGVIAGIVGGIGLAFFLDYLDHGLKTPEDVEHYLGIPPLASFFATSSDKLDPNESQKLSAILEAVYGEKALQVISVCSSVPGEGANKVARALADAWSDDPSGPTLLIDIAGDGVREAPGGRGLCDLVMNGGHVEDCVSAVGPLYVMGRGSQRDIPTYVWKSDRMQNLLNTLRGRFSHVIFHMPPVLKSGDAVNFARAADGNVVVIKADNTRREVAQRALELLAEAKGRVLGAILLERKQVIPSAVYKRI